MKKPALSVQDVVLIGTFSAILSVLSQVSVPIMTGVPLTLQTFAVALCGFSLGIRRGALSVAAYLIMGAAGLPVFANFRGGFFLLAGPTGGFLIGFMALAMLCGTQSLWLAAVGLLICHLLGATQYAAVSGIKLLNSFRMVSLPFLFKDAVSILSAKLAADIIKSRMGAAVGRVR